MPGSGPGRIQRWDRRLNRIPWRWLPGFRSGVWWKRTVATPLYLFLIFAIVLDAAVHAPGTVVWVVVLAAVVAVPNVASRTRSGGARGGGPSSSRRLKMIMLPNLLFPDTRLTFSADAVRDPWPRLMAAMHRRGEHLIVAPLVGDRPALFGTEARVAAISPLMELEGLARVRIGTHVQAGSHVVHDATFIGLQDQAGPGADLLVGPLTSAISEWTRRTPDAVWAREAAQITDPVRLANMVGQALFFRSPDQAGLLGVDDVAYRLQFCLDRLGQMGFHPAPAPQPLESAPRFPPPPPRPEPREVPAPSQDVTTPGPDRAGVEAQLDQLVGLAEVKAQVRRVLNRMEVARRAGQRAPRPQNLVFEGAPGTGKSTVARLYGSLLVAANMLPEAKFVEVGRAELVGGYQGQTALKVKEAFASARPGVLFIDEVYALKTNDSDSFGQEAIDTLVKLMEDEGGQVAVLVAGYGERMPAFLRSNPGLSSRFTRTIVFPNYSVTELVAIFERMAAQEHMGIGDGTREAVEAALDRLRERPDFSNARDVRQLLERMIDQLAERFDAPAGAGTPVLLPEDVVEGAPSAQADDARLQRLRAELDAMVGLAAVKKQVDRMVAAAALSQRRRLEGRPELPVGQHLVFGGAPGTGKTTVARLYGQMLAAIGVLRQGQVVEATRAELVGEHLGETALKVQRLFDRARGGVLFIDEAHGLRTDERDYFGQEAVDTLVKLMDDLREEVVVIAAGYSEDMRRFLATNSGLKVRFGTALEFENYTVSELVQVFERMATERGFTVGNDALEAVRAYADQAPKGPRWGNAKEMRNLLETAIQRLAERCRLDPSAEDTLLLPGDLQVDQRLRRRLDAPVRDQAQVDVLLGRLDAMVGLEQAKREIRGVLNLIAFNQARVRQGLPASQLAEHLIFAGPAGTGKTTVANIYAELLAASGVLARGLLVFKTRGSLVGAQGSAKLMEAAFEQALGGVLFIDEAYALTNGSFDLAGQEAVDALLGLMEEHRDEVVVIAAGYADRMQEFLAANEGLRSRFGKTITFSGYRPEELVRIFENLARTEHYALAPGCTTVLLRHFGAAAQQPGFGNARDVRNLLAASVARLAARHEMDPTVDIATLTPADLGGSAADQQSPPPGPAVPGTG